MLEDHLLVLVSFPNAGPAVSADCYSKRRSEPMRIVMPSASRIKDVLFSDADAFFEPLARTWLRSRRAHPLRWQLIDLAYGVAGTVMVWLFLGRLAGIVVGAVWALLTVLGLVAYAARLLAAPKANGDGRDDS
jgi:hypothetical protein